MCRRRSTGAISAAPSISAARLTRNPIYQLPARFNVALALAHQGFLKEAEAEVGGPAPRPAGQQLPPRRHCRTQGRQHGGAGRLRGLAQGRRAALARDTAAGVLLPAHRGPARGDPVVRGGARVQPRYGRTSTAGWRWRTCMREWHSGRRRRARARSRRGWSRRWPARPWPEPVPRSMPTTAPPPSWRPASPTIATTSKPGRS